MQFRLEKKALKDLKYWKQNNKPIYKRIFKLLLDIEINFFTGIGKPEPLKENLLGWWSRRINHKHRLIYRIENNVIVILSCRYHY